MKPSSSSTRASATLSLVAGISTSGRSISLALRMRVSMSAIGSVIMAVSSLSRLPGCLADARDHPVARKLTETNPAAAELAVHRSGPAADLAAADNLDARVARQDLLRVALIDRLLQFGLVLLHGFKLPTELGFFCVR